jgi:hypothetical protein
MNYRRVAGQGIQAGFLCVREVVVGEIVLEVSGLYPNLYPLSQDLRATPEAEFSCLFGRSLSVVARLARRTRPNQSG